MERNRLHAIALEMVRFTTHLQYGTVECKEFIKTIPLEKKYKIALNTLLNGFNPSCACHRPGCVMNFAVEYTKNAMNYAGLFETREEFTAILNVIIKWAKESQAGLTDEHYLTGACRDVADSMLQDVYDINDPEPSQFYYRRPEIKTAIESHYGKPEYIEKGGIVIALDATNLVNKVAKAYETGEIFETVFGNAPVVVDEWADVIVMEAEF